jgi:hypothetical protein
MSRRAAVWLAVAIGVVVAGAAVSFFQADRFETDGEAAPDVADAVETLTAVGDCPWGEAGCILAQGIERALQRGRLDSVMDFGASRFYICPGGNQGPQPLCQGVGPDEGRRGYPVTRRFLAESVLSEEATRQRIQRFLDSIRPNARDEVGPGGLRFYAFTCDLRAIRVQPVSCAHLGIVLSAIVADGATQQRELLIFWAVGGFAGKSLPFAEVWDGPVRPEEIDILFRNGGTLADLGEVHVIDR